MNRDEIWDRKAESINFWPGKGRIVAGRDEEKGGTWLGINRKGKNGGVLPIINFVGYCVAITNIRISNAIQGSMSRGLLVKNLLEKETFNPQEWLSVIRASGCASFNLVFADTMTAGVFVYCSETDEMQELDLQTPFTLANAPPRSNWPRERRILEQFGREIDYLELLGDCAEYQTGPVEYTSLPIRILPTTKGTVDGQLRGTVSSSVITVDNDNFVSFTERTWNCKNQPVKNLSFEINAL